MSRRPAPTERPLAGCPVWSHERRTGATAREGSRVPVRCLATASTAETMASNDFTLRIKRSALEEEHRPAETTRITAHFANLAQGERR